MNPTATFVPSVVAGPRPRTTVIGLAVTPLSMKMNGPSARGPRGRGLSPGGDGGGIGGHHGHSNSAGNSKNSPRGPTRGGGVGGGGAGGPGFLSGENNPFPKLARMYGQCLHENPLLTKAFTSFIGFAAASCIIEGNGIRSMDFRPPAIVGATGALVHGLGGHYYYGASEQFLPGVTPINLAGKTAVDFLVWLPIISLSLVLVRDLSEGKLKDVESWKSALQKSWTIPSPVWIFFSGVMFKFSPVHERTAFYNCALLFSALAKKLADTETTPVEK